MADDFLAELQPAESKAEPPNWNLGDLYSGEDDPELASDFEWIGAECKRLAECYKGRIGSIDAKELLSATRAFERFSAKSAKIAAFSELRYAEDTSDPERGRFMAYCQERLNHCQAELVFFELELARIGDAEFEAMTAASPELATYRPFFEMIRKTRPHLLSLELEQYILDRSVSGPLAWTRLFDESIARMRFRFNGSDHSLAETLNAESDHDRNIRMKSARALARGFNRQLPLFTAITNTLALDKAVNDRWRKHESPQSSRHLANDVEADVVEALKNVVVGSYEKISHRYYGLKAQWLDLRHLEIWDRNAPLPISSDARISWSRARETVLSSFEGFSPKLAEIGNRFFENGWIDAPMRSGKSPGAFAHSVSADAHPYILLNYSGKPRDVMVLAHELGHGVHQVLAAELGQYLSSTPLTLAETASVFGEMLTFHELLGSAEDPEARKSLLAGKIEDMINTVIRQIAFYEFESRLHERRSAGEISSDEIGRIWLDVQSASLGPKVKLMRGYEVFWAYVPHFIHSPFYVYSYAFGHGLVQALYAEYAAGHPGFEEKYLAMLRAGGSRNYKDLLRSFGLDPTEPEFWQKGLNYMCGLIDQLEDEMGRGPAA